VPVAVHCCAANAPVGLLHRAGVRAVSVDLDLTTTAIWDEIGTGMNEGLWLGLGALPTDRTVNADEVARRVLRPIRTLGLDPGLAAHLVLTPSCGMASATREQAVTALRTLRTAAGIVTEQLVE
jgi:methionine synthase II (cobalamin-independent)